MPEPTITVWMLETTKRPIGYTAWTLADERRSEPKKKRKRKKGKR